MNFPNLQKFNCHNNQLTSLPLYILNWKNIRHINCYNNPIKLSPQIEEFIIKNIKKIIFI